MALAHHIMLRLVDSRVIAPDEKAGRALACSVLRVGRSYRLIVFRSSDTHLHLTAACCRVAAGQLARRLEISLRRRLALPVPFERARVKVVGDQRHLGNVFDYSMRQEQRHGIAVDPLFTASNLPDLLGMRLVGGYTRTNLRRYLPRVSRGQLLGYLDRPDLDAAPLAVDDLADAAAAAFGLPDLCGKRPDVARARRAAARVAAGLATASAIGELLGVDRRTVFRLRSQAIEPAAVEAVRLQLRLRSASRSVGVDHGLPPSSAWG